MSTPLLTSGKIALRPLEMADMPLMYKIENDTSLWQAANTVQPLSRAAISNFISTSSGDIYRDRQLRLVIDSNDAAVGFIDLTDFSPRHMRAEVGITVMPQHQSQGIGTIALHLMEQYAAHTLFLHQLYAYVAPDNEISMRLFTGAGYQRVGILQEWVKTPHGYNPIILFQKIF